MQDANCCGCCEGLSAETPVEVYNRPGLTAILYRTGDYTRFRESLLARLSTSHLPALRQLTTRENNDFTIALLDAWACVSDVLTFYQERIANESYLGTATEQLSILELARLIGYELRPGVAAGTWLAFILDDAAGGAGQITAAGTPQTKAVPASTTIETGTQVQSVPGKDETPQTFETVEPLEARAEWNALRPRLTQPQLSVQDNNIIVVNGTNNDLKPGDVLLLANGMKLKKIVKLTLDEEAKTTWLYTSTGSVIPPFNQPALFVPSSDADAFPGKSGLTKNVIDNLISNTWKEEDIAVIAKSQGWAENELQESMANALAATTAADQVVVFRKRAAVFGYNALKQVTYKGRVPTPASAWQEWDLQHEENSKIYLDTTYEQILPGSWVAVQKSTDSLDTATVYPVNEVNIRARTDYGLSAKSTVLTIPSASSWWENYTDLRAIRSIAIHTQSAPLPLAETPVLKEISGDTVMLNRYYPGLKTGKTVIVSGDRDDLKGVSASEARTLDKVLVAKGFTVLVFDKPLAYTYVRKTVTINANTAFATHGETVKEVLGSGDYTKPFQQFTLKQPPLTFTSADTPPGTLSTLELRVNDMLWHEVPSLYNHGPGEHIYTTRQDDSAKTTLTFGDGKNGARLPTGQDNIKATYRKGIGTGGLVKASQLSQLVTRPLGVKGATNPLAATGAEDRELLADARTNARLTIYTLDRIVSLQDYEDFARSFAGISKSLATWTWYGQKQGIYITIAGANGAVLDPDSKPYQGLLSAMGKNSIPGVPVAVDSYLPRFFRLTAAVKVDPDYITGDVMKAVEQQLRTTFSFSQRQFGQPVTYSQVVATIQQVAGVIAVDMDELYRSDEPPALQDRLDASMPRPGSTAPLPAELLTLDPRPVDLIPML